ncbi:MAG TPA: sigma-70 family RNA polymerase sigma factor [Acidimicrobiia bacterium]|jgi:RNA polymerase sigma-70 factor (sigma-E family)
MMSDAALPRATAVPAEAPADGPSFADCYRELRPEMVRLATLLVGNREVAVDLVQDAFVGLHRAWHRVRAPEAYVRRALVYRCRSHHRRRAVERRYLRSAAKDVSELDADELTDALAALTPRQRAAIVLRYYADLPDAEIATALRCRVGTVPSLIHRGLAELRKVIEP